MDISGKDRFRTVAIKAFNSVNGIKLIFGLTRKISFDNLNNWLAEINENLANPFIVLFGNKTDIEKEKWESNIWRSK